MSISVLDPGRMKQISLVFQVQIGLNWRRVKMLGSALFRTSDTNDSMVQSFSLSKHCTEILENDISNCLQFKALNIWLMDILQIHLIPAFFLVSEFQADFRNFFAISRKMQFAYLNAVCLNHFLKRYKDNSGNWHFKKFAALI